MHQKTLLENIMKTPNEAKKLMQHGKDWAGVDLTGWTFTEKMDGCRAYWDGAALYTKEGNVIAAPHITQALPQGMALDGELWAGRGQFEAARLFTQYGKNPERVVFVAFDAPGVAGPWPQRINAAQVAWVRVVPFWTVEGMEDLHQAIRSFLAAGAEGLMVRKPDTGYKPGRSAAIVKIKAHSLPLFEQCEEFTF
jgi:DNA ligase-1